MSTSAWQASEEDVAAIVGARHGDPFALLGPHDYPDGIAIRALVPGAATVRVRSADGGAAVALNCRHPDGFFEGLLPEGGGWRRYRLLAVNAGGAWAILDPFMFSPVLGAVDDYLLIEGTHRALYERLGAHPMVLDGVAGVHFALWAPHARRVSVVGDFNAWDGRRHPMRKRIDSGLWEIFAPGAGEGAIYKFEISGADGTLQPLKADPFGFAAELRPSTASVVARTDALPWTDGAWLRLRSEADPRGTPMAIYEVHLGSWRRAEDGGFLTYDAIAATLIPYVAEMGFTHVEFMPLNEHPLDDSWGYQPIGLFAPTRRYDFGRREVANVLAASALYWLDRFHIDGLRVDAVASMLYLDYSRRPGEWVPNEDGGRDNRDAVRFLRDANTLAYGLHPGTVTIAEESTEWPGVSQPVDAGGLGFGFKWNMGWMHDTLDYIAQEPVHRRWHHDKLTFGLLYGFTENFVLPLSHDEVVHGKRSILGRIPGDAWQRVATARAYYAFMWAHPGKKLLFMGQEFGQLAEWNFAGSLDWHLLADPLHEGFRSCVRDLNRLYRATPALHARDCEPEGFQWIVADDAAQSVFAWLRRGSEGDPPVAVVCNFTPVPRHAYRIGLPLPGRWREVLNTDAAAYGGSGLGNLGAVEAVASPSHGLSASAALLLPPLAAVYLLHEPG